MTETETLELKESRAELFGCIGTVESRGRGIQLIMSSEPDMESRKEAGLFISGVARPSFQSDVAALTTASPPESTDDKTVDKKPLVANLVLCAILRLEPLLTQKQLGARLGLTAWCTSYLTDELQCQGLLHRCRTKKMGAWLVSMSLSEMELALGR